MGKLIVPRRDRPDGEVLSITPESAGWDYVGFRVHKLTAGQILRENTGDSEICLVLLRGRANVQTGGFKWDNIGKRLDVFEKIPPYSVYMPPGNDFVLEALTDLEAAVCSAPGKGTYEPRLISPDEVGIEMRGAGNTRRLIHNILPEQKPADSLLVVEVFTPEGNWSSYPPHKHDRDHLPEESYLEETYYFEIQPSQGFAVQRVYTDDHSLDEMMAVKHGEAVMVPKGYHPVSAPPGYEVYYLNVMAGPVRTWKFKNDPGHEWILTRPNAEKRTGRDQE